MSDFDITQIDTPTTMDKRLDFETGSCGSVIIREHPVNTIKGLFSKNG